MHWHLRNQRRACSVHQPARADTGTTNGDPDTPPLPAALPAPPQPPEIGTASGSLRSTQTCSPCQRCGACCAFYLVSFPRDEAVDDTGTRRLYDLSLPLGETSRYMKGTKARHPRCQALLGTVGSHVSCSIYAHRPSTCCTFQRSWESDAGNTLCDRARCIFGLEPFSQY
jgi:uncharacterized protein